MEITTQQRIELLQLAKAIADKETPQVFAKRSGFPEVDTDDFYPPLSHLEITLHVYRQLLSVLIEQ